MEQQIFVVGTIVENKPGVLHKVSNMLRRKGFNIESISVGPTERNGWARMTITFRADEATARQLIRQMEKLLDVVGAKILNQSKTVARELALVKLRVEDRERVQTQSTTLMFSEVESSMFLMKL
jgi:acetolactate synthase-1/3 small subunit